MAKEKKQDCAQYSDYVALIEDTFGETRRDIFSGRLMVKHEGRWRGLLEATILGKLKSLCRDSSGWYSATAIEDHIQRLTGETKPELLVEIPTWDRRDRIKEIVSYLNLARPIKTHAEELIKDFGARMFDRLENPSIQNRCLIFYGQQGIGKDYLIDVLVGGLGEFAKDLTIGRYPDERELDLVLSQGLAVKIGEFDRTGRMDPATLKNIITKPFADSREPYARAPSRKELRCSFIASSNTLDVFRDHTGNRRYILIELEGKKNKAIKFGYPDSKEDQLQILSQFRELSRAKFKTMADTESCLKARIDRLTPEDPTEAMLYDFDDLVARLPDRCFRRHEEQARICNFDLSGVFKELSKNHGMSIPHIRTLLRQKGRTWHTKQGRGFWIPVELERVTEVSRDVTRLSPSLSPLNH
jgi:hypothetical protein